MLSLPVPTIRLTGVVEGHISYHKLQNLGVGGFGEVFKGEQMSGKLFAFKRSLPKAKATSDIDYWINEQLHAVKSLAHEAEVYFDPNFNSGNLNL